MAAPLLSGILCARCSVLGDPVKLRLGGVPGEEMVPGEQALNAAGADGEGERGACFIIIISDGMDLPGANEQLACRAW